MMHWIPFVLQGALMTIDEFYCHRRRELKRWERIGHPLDTLFFVSCLTFLLWMPPTELTLWIYTAIAAANCLFITKDEWQHRVLATGFENWLHALLFILHPVVLAVAGYLWWQGSPEFHGLVGVFAGLAAGFALYQIVYWNLRPV